MTEIAPEIPKKELPEKIRRALRKGESIYHSTQPLYVSKKNPEGKWVACVRVENKGVKRKLPTRAFSTPKEAFEYVESFRPDAKGRISAARRGEPTVGDLYEYVTAHRQKRLSEITRAGKATRWDRFIKEEWAYCPLSQVTSRLAQEWITDMEQRIMRKESGVPPGLPTFEKVRTDLHALFECLPSFSPEYEDRRNPFADLDYLKAGKRHKVTIESQFFAPLLYACTRYVELGFCTTWIAEQFLTSLFTGLRFGEVFALCDDQINFEDGAIVVDRSMRRNCRAIDPTTRLETGEVVRTAMHYPKGGTELVSKTRVVPLSGAAADLLKKVVERERTNTTGWSLLWPSEVGTFREQTRFQTAWDTLRTRLQELAEMAPLVKKEQWPELPKRRGWTHNPLIAEAREDATKRLPAIFGSIDFRDTRNSFASYMNEVGLSQATREHTLGHGSGLTNTVYTEITSNAFQDARNRLSDGWAKLDTSDL